MMIRQMGRAASPPRAAPPTACWPRLHDVMQGKPPDLVLSGVNRGNNSAENALYSGTLGGAMEAALQGLPAIALSQYYGPDNRDLDDPFEAARLHGLATLSALLERGVWTRDDYGIFYNVNFPPVPAAAVKGLRPRRQGFRRDMGFGVQPVHSPSGRRFLWVTGAPQQQPTVAGTDADVNLEGYISVTPMRADLTAHDALEPLRAIE